MKRTLGVVVTALALSLGGGVVSATAAHAGIIPKCTGSIVTGTGNNDGTIPILNRVDEQIGQIEVYYNGSTGRNCAMIRSYLGRPVSMSVRLTVQNGPSQYASGRWTYYSDGAELYAPGRCISVSGSINGGTTDQGSASRGNGNCG